MLTSDPERLPAFGAGGRKGQGTSRPRQGREGPREGDFPGGGRKFLGY